MRLIFGIPLETSVEYARTCISKLDRVCNQIEAGYVPRVVAQIGNFLKEYGESDFPPRPSGRLLANTEYPLAQETEDIFAINGNPVQMSHLQQIFNSPRNYGMKVRWGETTVHDAAGLLLRYLKCLPGSIIPYAHYHGFVEQLGPYLERELDSDETMEGIYIVHQLVRNFPEANRYLYFYVTDIMGCFTSKATKNKMTALRLVSVLQPSILAGPPSEMDAEAHHIANRVVIFLIENAEQILDTF